MHTDDRTYVPDPLDTFEQFFRYTLADIDGLTPREAFEEAAELIAYRAGYFAAEEDWLIRGGLMWASVWLNNRIEALMAYAFTRAA